VRQVANSVPIYQAATFAAEDSAELGDILADRKPGYAYARIDNPTASAMAAAVAELEGAEAALQLRVRDGRDPRDAVRAGPGGRSHRQHARGVRQHAAADDRRCWRGSAWRRSSWIRSVPDAVEAALPGARVLYLETISNPTIIVADIAALAARAHRHGVTVVVDNTFASPFLCRPLELGADLVVESCTKWIGGHSDVVAGSVAGSRELVSRVKALEVDAGGIAAPFTAFLVLRGIETLHVRMERHCATALALARFLEARPEVASVMYPGLASHPQAAVAQRQLRAGGGMLALDLGERAAAAAFLDALSIPPRTASLGSIQTIAVHPPSSTHRQLSKTELLEAGIPQGLVRISVGLEDVDDLAADFSVGLAAARAAALHGDPARDLAPAAETVGS
jgi:methionine-gamma-lyase